MVVILIEVATEALAFVRELLTAKSLFTTLDKTMDTIDDIVPRESLRHQVVLGEHAVLFILGKRTLQTLLKSDEYTSNDRLDYITLCAISNFVKHRTSDDVKAVICDFAVELGRECQRNFPSTAQHLEKYLSQPANSYTSEDPVYESIQTEANLDATSRSILENLGVPAGLWTGVREHLTTRQILSEWTEVVKSVVPRDVTVQKYHTFMGYMLVGAKQIIGSPSLDINILGGADGLGFYFAGVNTLPATAKPREELPAGRSITTEMIRATSTKITRNKGFIQTDKGDWANLQDVSIEWKTDKTTKEVKRTISLKVDVGEKPTTPRFEHVLDLLHTVASKGFSAYKSGGGILAKEDNK